MSIRNVHQIKWCYKYKQLGWNIIQGDIEGTNV